MDDKDIEDAVDRLMEGAADDLEKSYVDAVSEIRNMVRSVYDGTADAETRQEFKGAIEELMVAWISLVTGIFQSINESPVSPAAIDFYTIMDTHRAMLDLDPKSPSIIDDLQEKGIIGTDDQDDTTN